MTSNSRISLWLRLAGPFVCFTAAGTIGLLLFLNAADQHRSAAGFAALANANAEFIRAAHIPPTDRFAGYLSQVLGVEARFHQGVAPDSRHEAVTVAVQPGVELTLIRERPTLLFRPATLGALAGFWGLSLALAWAVARPYLETQRLALLGQMATALAHEIQNPVAAIRLHAQLAGYNAIIHEAATIESLVNQWQFLARPEPPRKSTVNLRELVTGVTQTLSPLAAHARVQLTAQVPPELSVAADRRRLTQAVGNLVLNAIQAQPQGGAVTITATGADGQVRLRVADAGSGFSAKAQARCPELFYSEKEGGMGIGLAVTNEIIHAHGGTLTLANAPAGGAVATLVLPEGKAKR